MFLLSSYLSLKMPITNPLYIYTSYPWFKLAQETLSFVIQPGSFHFICRVCWFWLYDIIRIRNTPISLPLYPLCLLCLFLPTLVTCNYNWSNHSQHKYKRG
uniref:Uncharacterized protein n=1 Tax=Austropuccinia psidii TaxID=181123 RepID=A0A513X042_9BASI|nr:hypothetical protein [Austropuccinia psidii]QDH07295.1 hypothetical protein [Austropuccinia psidii]